MMRRGRLLAGATVASTIASAMATVALVALAQPRGPRAPHTIPSKPKAASSGPQDNPYDDKAPASAAGSTPSAPNAAPASAPAAAPAAPAEAIDGGHLSPLTPAPSEFADASVPPSSVEYDRLLADIAALRARVAAVSDTLFHSRIAISLETSGDRTKIASLGISVDDGQVWTSPATFLADSPTTVYEHSIAPGHHAISIDIERRDKRYDVFRSEQHSRFIVEVPLDQRLAIEVKLSDDSSLGDFPGDRQGQYDLRVRAHLRAQPLRR